MLVTNDAERPSGSGSNPKLARAPVSFTDIIPFLGRGPGGSAVSSPKYEDHWERRIAAHLCVESFAPLRELCTIP
jgi:hypothetical protein